MAQPSIDILINATTKGFDQVTQQLQKLVSQLHMLSQTPVVSQLNNMNQQMVQLGQQVGALTSKMAQYTAATDKQTQANNRSVLSALTMQNTMLPADTKTIFFGRRFKRMLIHLSVFPGGNISVRRQ